MTDTVLQRWKAIPSFPDYEINERGIVRRLIQSRGVRIGTILTPRLLRGKYWAIQLRHNHKKHFSTVHRLILETFVGPCPDGYEGHHKDGNSFNNYYSNLEYILIKTHRRYHYSPENLVRKGADNGRAKLTETDIMEIRAKYKEGKYLYKELAEIYHVSMQNIEWIVNHKSWRHI